MNGFRLRMLFLAASVFSAVPLVGCATNSSHPGKTADPYHFVSQYASADTDLVPEPDPIPAEAVDPSYAETSIAPNPVPSDPVKVLGEVNKPGSIRFREGADLSFYLAQAGGVSQGNELEKVQIIRGKPGKRISQDIQVRDHTALPSLKSGDIVVVHAEKPASGILPKGLSVAAATLLGTVALLIIAL